MSRPVTVAIAIASFVALMFWLGMGATGKNAALVSARPKAEYANMPHPYVPIQRLKPFY